MPPRFLEINGIGVNMNYHLASMWSCILTILSEKTLNHYDGSATIHLRMTHEIWAGYMVTALVAPLLVSRWPRNQWTAPRCSLKCRLWAPGNTRNAIGGHSGRACKSRITGFYGGVEGVWLRV